MIEKIHSMNLKILLSIRSITLDKIYSMTVDGHKVS